MNIHFTGVKNIGYQCRQYREAYYDDGTTEYLDPLDDELEKEDYDADVEEHYLTLQLTDDYNGKDLTEFRNKLKISDIKDNFMRPASSDLLTINVDKENLTEDYTKPLISLYLNGAYEPLEINDKNLSLLSFIAKLVKRVSTMPDNQFVVNRDYLENEAETSLVPGNNLRLNFGKYYKELIEQEHSPEFVKDGADTMAKIITERMIDYFS